MADAKTTKNYQIYFGQIKKQLVTHVDAKDTTKFVKTFDKLLKYLSKRPSFSPKLAKMETWGKIDQYVDDHQMEISVEKFKAFKKFGHSMKTTESLLNKPNNPQLKILLSKIAKLRKKESRKEFCICTCPFQNYRCFYHHLKNDHKELYIRIPDEKLADIDDEQVIESENDEIIIPPQTKHSDHQNIILQHQS